MSKYASVLMISLGIGLCTIMSAKNNTVQNSGLYLTGGGKRGWEGNMKRVEKCPVGKWWKLKLIRILVKYMYLPTYTPLLKYISFRRNRYGQFLVTDRHWTPHLRALHVRQNGNLSGKNFWLTPVGIQVYLCVWFPWFYRKKFLSNSFFHGLNKYSDWHCQNVTTATVAKISKQRTRGK